MAQHYVHQPPQQKRGFPVWAAILIGAALVMVLCCGITGVVAVLGDDDPGQTSPTTAGRGVGDSTPSPDPTEEPTEEPTPEPEPTEEPTPDPTEEPTSGPLDRLPDYWAAYGCENFACILDVGE